MEYIIDLPKFNFGDIDVYASIINQLKNINTLIVLIFIVFVVGLGLIYYLFDKKLKELKLIQEKQSILLEELVNTKNDDEAKILKVLEKIEELKPKKRTKTKKPETEDAEKEDK